MFTAEELELIAEDSTYYWWVVRLSGGGESLVDKVKLEGPMPEEQAKQRKLRLNLAGYSGLIAVWPQHHLCNWLSQRGIQLKEVLP